MPTTVTPISRDELRARLDAGEPTVVVEALGPLYYDAAHVPGALNLPHDQVDTLHDQVIGAREAFVVVYCSNTACQNSVVASRRLVELGYTNVHEYVEGKEDWAGAGLPLESS